MTGEARRLRALAERLAAAYVEATAPTAVLLTGSAATGDADGYSDVDLIVYHERLPPDDALAEVRRRVGVSDADVSGDRLEDVQERFFLDGVECQTGHVTVAAWERERAVVVVEQRPDPVALKIMSGFFGGVALHGAAVVAAWRDAAPYGDELQRAAIEANWTIFPLWTFEEQLRERGATVWRYETLVGAAQSLLAVVAAVNRIWFSPLELKRPTALIGRFEAAPVEFAARLDALFVVDPVAETLEALVRDVADLARPIVPDLDDRWVRGGRSVAPGTRLYPRFGVSATSSPPSSS